MTLDFDCFLVGVWKYYSTSKWGLSDSFLQPFQILALLYSFKTFTSLAVWKNVCFTCYSESNVRESILKNRMLLYTHTHSPNLHPGSHVAVKKKRYFEDNRTGVVSTVKCMHVKLSQPPSVWQRNPWGHKKGRSASSPNCSHL